MLKTWIAVLILLLNGSAWSLICNLTAMKNPCWFKPLDKNSPNYEITINIYDTSLSIPKKIKTLVIPANQNIVKIPFKCTLNHRLQYRATFTPAVWDTDKGKDYQSKEVPQVPSTVEKGETWDFRVCFGNDFSGDPLSTDPKGNESCECGQSGISAIDKKEWLDQIKGLGP